jgi:hypothetical protein
MTEQVQNDWVQSFHWGFGQGFWYADPLKEIKGLTETQLYWSPSPEIPCILWHVGHIARQERIHIGHLLQGLSIESLIPPKYEIFGLDRDITRFADMIQSVDAVKKWVHEVRSKSHKYIEILTEKDFLIIPPSSFEGNSVAQVLIQTIGHTGLHLGQIQATRSFMAAAR